MFHLPIHLQIKIYSYDPTYHNLQMNVLKQINTYGSGKRNRNNPNSPCLKKSDLVGKYIISRGDKNIQIF